MLLAVPFIANLIRLFQGQDVTARRQDLPVLITKGDLEFFCLT